MSKRPTHWADIQEKTFTRWINDILRPRGIKIDDIGTDLKDGLVLLNLLEILSKKKIGKWNKHPRIEIQKRENLQKVMEFTKAQQIELVNVGPGDFIDDNKRIILGYVWKLIYFYEICKGDPAGHLNAKNELLEWVRAQIPEYHKEHPINNFKGKTWYKGLAVCALADALIPTNSKGQRKDFEYNLKWQDLDPKKREDNCTEGIDAAYDYLRVDKLLEGNEMCQKKCDEHAIMCYIAQFRNINEEFLQAPEGEEEIPEISAATLCRAYGPGLIEAVVDSPAEFTVVAPMCQDTTHTLEVKIEGPTEVEWKQEDNKDGTYNVTYTPTESGEYVVSVVVDGEHIPGSTFHVLVLEEESLGGEGKIRVYFSTTSSSSKSKKDRFSLERLLTAKKVHLRKDFEPWQAVDLMTTHDRNLIFKKAGTRLLPIVFVDDKYVGDFDKLNEMEELGKLDDLLAMDGVETVSEEEHMARLKKMDDSKTDDS